ncbi:MAG: AAA family ATPase [Nitrospinae bacterium]|nr:AAA family ATPase [Nitrospinota bacterium]
MERLSYEVEGRVLHLSHPTEMNITWVGQQDLLQQLLAAWITFDEKDIPLNPRIIGKPGVGKTTLAYTAGKSLNRDIYIFQGTIDTRPEDLIIIPVIDENQKIKYAASPLVSAMIKGGICIIDEGNRMSEKSWASLAPLLDQRRYVESVVAGIKIPAHPDFRVCVTLNEDASTFEIPEYISSRLAPQIFVDYPEYEEEFRIIAENVPQANDELVDYVVSFLQDAHTTQDAFSIRDGINITRYALRLLKNNCITGEKKFSIKKKNRKKKIIHLEKEPIKDKKKENEFTSDELINATIQSIQMVLGTEATVYFSEEEY